MTFTATRLFVSLKCICGRVHSLSYEYPHGKFLAMPMAISGRLNHRRMRQECWRGCSPLTRAKPLFFGQKLNFSGRSQKPKN